MRIHEDTILSYYNFNSLSNDIIDLAKEIMPDKVIYINFLNDRVQATIKVSKHDTDININEGEIIPIENAVCNNIDFKNSKPLVIENTKENSLDENVNKTIENSNIGSYLGIPIVFKNGQRFGALCAAHHDSSKFDEGDIKLLEKIANLFSYYLELESQAYHDALTGLENTHFLTLKAEEIIKNGGLLIMLDLDNFKEVNDTFGHYVGDLILKELGGKLAEFTKEFKNYHMIRLGGDEFLIYIKDKISTNKIQKILKRLNKKLSNWDTNINEIKLTSSIGAYKFAAKKINNFNILYQKTDELLYQAKEQGKNCFIYNDNE